MKMTLNLKHSLKKKTPEFPLPMGTGPQGDQIQVMYNGIHLTPRLGTLQFINII